MGVDINISTRQGEFFAGEAVKGTVTLNVTSNDVEGSSADELVLELVGKAASRVVYQAHHHGGDNRRPSTRTAYESTNFLEYELLLAAFGGKAAAGSHSFPFSIMLPPGLPPSMKEVGGGGSCSIVYRLGARLYRPGILSYDAKSKAELKVFSRPQEVVATPVVVGPDTKKVKTCCCCNNGSMSIGFQADRSVIGLNEPLGITIVARNDSSISVKEMRVEIKQVARWRAHGHEECRTVTVASTVVSGSQLGAVQQAMDKGASRGRSPSVVADAARVEIQETLATGAGARYTLVVPDTCIETLGIGIIEVQHMLSVELKTSTFTSSPDVWTPLRVQHVVGDGVRPGAAPFVASSVAVAVPYATAVEVDANGYPAPVLVPQELVKLEFGSDMPDPSAPAMKL